MRSKRLPEVSSGDLLRLFASLANKNASTLVWTLMTEGGELELSNKAALDIVREFEAARCHILFVFILKPVTCWSP